MFVDDVIGMWAERSDVPIWYPTPSLVQHIGETSTIGSFELRPAAFAEQRGSLGIRKPSTGRQLRINEGSGSSR